MSSESENKRNSQGEIIGELMRKKGWNQTELASHLRVSRIGVNQLLGGIRAVSPLMALKLAAVFNEDPNFFLAPQRLFDLERAYESNREELEEIRRESSGEDDTLAPNNGLLR